MFQERCIKVFGLSLVPTHPVLVCDVLNNVVDVYQLLLLLMLGTPLLLIQSSYYNIFLFSFGAFFLNIIISAITIL